MTDIKTEIEFPVAGARFRGDYYKTGQFTLGDSITLEPEPTNQYDPNAIRVIHAGFHLGYVPKAVTHLVGPIINGPHTAHLRGYFPDKKAEERFIVKVTQL